MSKLFTAGRILFGAALIGLGVEPLVIGHLPAALVPLRAPLPAWVAILLGALLVTAVLATIRKEWTFAPLALAAFPLLVLLTTQLPALARAPGDPGVWSGVFQVVGFLAGAVLMVHARAGRIILAAALLVYGVQHFMYAAFVASLVPAWIPGHLFWAYATGFAFCGAAVSVLTNVATRIAGACLGIMFGSWVLVLHLPRIAADPGKETAWSSGLVALALAGVGLLLAAPAHWTPTHGEQRALSVAEGSAAPAG